MTKIPRFGFSSFLKLISVDDKDQRKLIDDRYRPKDGKRGHDSHRSLRQAIEHFATGAATLHEVFSATSEIKNKVERRSTKLGIIRFAKWRKSHTDTLSFCGPFTFPSPSGLFRIKFETNFIIELEGQRIAVHVWNTKSPRLSKQIAIAALSMVRNNWPIDWDVADDFAVLSLRDMQLHRLSEMPFELNTFAQALLVHVDRMCANASEKYPVPRSEVGDSPNAYAVADRRKH